MLTNVTDWKQFTNGGQFRAPVKEPVIVKKVYGGISCFLQQLSSRHLAAQQLQLTFHVLNIALLLFRLAEAQPLHLKVNSSLITA